MFRSLSQSIAGLSKNEEHELSDLYQRKALPELAEFTQSLNMGSDFYALGRYSSDLEALQSNLSANILQDAEFKSALDALKTTLEQIKGRWAKSQYRYRCRRAT